MHKSLLSKKVKVLKSIKEYVSIIKRIDFLYHWYLNPLLKVLHVITIPYKFYIHLRKINLIVWFKISSSWQIFLIRTITHLTWNAFLWQNFPYNVTMLVKRRLREVGYLTTKRDTLTPHPGEWVPPGTQHLRLTLHGRDIFLPKEVICPKLGL